LMSRLPGHEFRQERISSFDMAFPSSRPKSPLYRELYTIEHPKMQHQICGRG
jgi:hypothetical protein